MTEEKLVELLIEKGYTISTAESCTGGLVAATIVNVSGASNVFNEGYVTYANSAKEKLAFVKRDTLNEFGAVSRQTAAEMAEGCCKNAAADVGISTTGIAGPAGGTLEKPVGLVYIGCSVKGKTIVEKHVFSGDRTRIRNNAVNCAIKLAINSINN